MYQNLYKCAYVIFYHLGLLYKRKSHPNLYALAAGCGPNVRRHCWPRSCGPGYPAIHPGSTFGTTTWIPSGYVFSCCSYYVKVSYYVENSMGQLKILHFRSIADILFFGKNSYTVAIPVFCLQIDRLLRIKALRDISWASAHDPEAVHFVFCIVWSWKALKHTFHMVNLNMFPPGKKQDETHEPECRHVCWETKI